MSLFSFFKSPENVKSLRAADFKEIIKNTDIQLVDVRTSEEFQQGTIANAALIDIYSRDFEKNIDERLDISRPVAVFCHSGARSMQAARLLSRKGFPMIYNLQGGMMSWQ